jgi:hypothetical protein
MKKYLLGFMFWKIFRICIWVAIWILVMKFLVPSDAAWIGAISFAVGTPIFLIADDRVWKEEVK